MTRDVCVTGLGAVTAAGSTATDSWESLLAGDNGVEPITSFDAEDAGCRSRIAGEATLPETGTERLDEVQGGRYSRLAVAAAAEAVSDAGYDPTEPDWDGDRVGTSVACSMGGIPELEAATEGRVRPRTTLQFMPNLAAGQVSISLDARGPLRSSSMACAAGLHAIADGVTDIRRGAADVVVAGGTEAILSRLGVEGFDALQTLSTRNDDPEGASRPFDADRDGFVVGEGAGAVVLEAESHAAERGATPLARIRGHGRTANAFHQARPPEDAAGMRRCLAAALSNADVAAGDVDHVNAHATSSPAGDEHEALALTETFPECPPVTSTKSAIGHTMAASGAIDSVFTTLALETGTLPPTHNYETPDPDCDVPVVAEPTAADPELAVNVASGFGGTNAAVVFERV
ncbi:beta-ketoacyl-[acyl-carrier-protein] synthase family protein [Haloarculaceae archaeon H-GB2-1]|nr:beta-ketoacyl-[acyl-carrier-protein] synthase family protein [Haloarculaceae archaeon H-GB1-1]MEA5388356.1 beta-ketoacyl-[acyl-carrier-protein] synthase family protein [Haloarculaceae archaeon H-GB11]MEA5406394.1 beta-ketoacyl-[acyl-carrier-protein] synthase family protein [Haloarculaceae archaeon H-GB2-1]